MAKEEHRFWITPELGQRLRELKLRAGLTMAVLEATRNEVYMIPAPARPWQAS